MQRLFFSLLLIAFCCAATLTFTASQGGPLGRLTFDADRELKRHRSSQTPTILYHGGPVMTGAKNLYVIYYGSFTTTQHAILDTFLQNLGGSAAFNVNTGYYNAQNVFVGNVLNYSPATDSYDDSYSLGKKLSGRFRSQ